jgi:RNA polymerase sigma factor (sigma-70 family)
MKRSATGALRSQGKRYMMAVVLGTALSAWGPARAAAEAPEATLQTVTAIHRYCTACWRNARLPPDCWTDCTQEVFCRLLERLAPDAWNQVLTAEGEERREFIRAIDTVKKRTQRSRKWSSGPVDTVADKRERNERRLADDREAVRLAATSLLSARQQRILQFSFEGWSVQEIARELKVSPERVSDEKYKAIHKLRDHFTQSRDL